MPYYELITYIDGPKAGASEKLAFQSSATSIDSVQALVQPILQKRSMMLTPSWQITAYRVTQTHDNEGLPVQRNSQLYYAQYEKNPAAQPPDPAWVDPQNDTAIRVNMYGPNRLRVRSMLLAGYPRDCEFNGFVFIDCTPSWLAPFNAWKASLKNLSLGWFTSGYETERNVVGYTTSPTGKITVTVDGEIKAGLTATAKWRVRLAGINDESELNGAWTATNYNAVGSGSPNFTFDLVGRFGVVPFTGGGSARMQKFTWTAVGITVPYGGGNGEESSILPHAVAKRQRGAPFGVGVGRARKRVRT